MPQPGMQLLNISLTDSASGFPYKDRKLYFIHFVHGKDPANLTFTFDIAVPDDYSDATVEVIVTGNYVHSKGYVKTPYFSKLLDSFPKWADVTAGLGVYSSYIL